MIDFSDITAYLKNYDGEKAKLMEVCGTHTASIAQNGIRSMLSPKIELVSGPGCPVCVTATSYIDRLFDISKRESFCVASFGDMLRVRGSKGSLIDAKAAGGNVKMLYSPFELLDTAKKNPDVTYVFAAVGFETTAPVYALLIKRSIEENIKNIKLLTSLKVMPPVLGWLCGSETDITGFIAPGHVSVITGTEIYKPIAEKNNVPFVVTGFEGKQIIESIYLLLKKRGQGEVFNLYTSVVKTEGNAAARETVSEYFERGDAVWRGFGKIEDSGLYLKNEYSDFDMGSRGLFEDVGLKNGCRCSDMLRGRIHPTDCPLFGKLCTPQNPAGACMVSSEGACRIWSEN